MERLAHRSEMRRLAIINADTVTGCREDDHYNPASRYQVVVENKKASQTGSLLRPLQITGHTSLRL